MIYPRPSLGIHPRPCRKSVLLSLPSLYYGSGTVRWSQKCIDYNSRSHDHCQGPPRGFHHFASCRTSSLFIHYNHPLPRRNNPQQSLSVVVSPSIRTFSSSSSENSSDNLNSSENSSSFATESSATASAATATTASAATATAASAATATTASPTKWFNALADRDRGGGGGGLGSASAVVIESFSYDALNDRTQYLIQVARGHVVDPTVQADECFAVLKAWRKMADHLHPAQLPKSRLTYPFWEDIWKHQKEQKEQPQDEQEAEDEDEDEDDEDEDDDDDDDEDEDEEQEEKTKMATTSTSSSSNPLPNRFHAARKAEELLLALEQNLLRDDGEGVAAAAAVAENTMDNTSTAKVAAEAAAAVPVLVPQAHFYTVVLKTYAESRSEKEAAEAAYTFLMRMIELSSNPRFSTRIKMNMIMFNAVISSYLWKLVFPANSREKRKIARKPEQVLYQAIHHYSKGLMDTPPKSKSFFFVVTAWTYLTDHASIREGAARSSKLIYKMASLHKEGVPMDLNLRVFTASLKLWSSAYTEDVAGALTVEAPDRAEAIMELLISLYEETKNPKLLPEIRCWDLLLKTWMRSTLRPESMEKCLSVFTRSKNYIKPHESMLYLLLRAAAFRGLGDTALTLFAQARSKPELFADRVVSDGIVERVMSALLKENRTEADSFDRVDAFFNTCVQSSNVRVGVRSYKYMMFALSQSKAENKAERARTILYEAHKRYQEGDEALKPNADLLGGALWAYSRTTGSREEQEKALEMALGIVRECESRFGMVPGKMIARLLKNAVHRLAPTEKHDEILLPILRIIKQDS